MVIEKRLVLWRTHLCQQAYPRILVPLFLVPTLFQAVVLVLRPQRGIQNQGEKRFQTAPAIAMPHNTQSDADEYVQNEDKHYALQPTHDRRLPRTRKITYSVASFPPLRSFLKRSKPFMVQFANSLSRFFRIPPQTTTLSPAPVAHSTLAQSLFIDSEVAKVVSLPYGVRRIPLYSSFPRPRKSRGRCVWGTFSFSIMRCNAYRTESSVRTVRCIPTLMGMICKEE